MSDTARTYRLAGRLVSLDTPVELLRPFEVSPVTRSEAVPVWRTEQEFLAQTKLLYQGPGWVGGRFREVQCRLGEEGYWLDFAGGARFAISLDGEWVSTLRTPDASQPGSQDEELAGPVAILALALQETYCLHASAVAVGERVVVFSGSSGAGKSTLAAFLDAAGGPQWRRIADDILPVSSGPRGLEALPHFPQLKLSRDEQLSCRKSERLPVRAIYFLDQSDPGGLQLGPCPLQPSESVLALVRHTVAARLFGPDRLKRHLQFCTRAGESIPVQRFVYPHSRELLPRVREALQADLND